MSRRNDRLSLNDMRNHAREAIALLDGASRQDFSDNRVLRLALARLIEIIGEAAYRLPPETRGQHPNIPWNQIMGMRN